jgi:acetyl esterase/lipase
MASWQARVTVLAMKALVKRQPAQAVDVARVRQTLGRVRRAALRLPAGWRARPAEVGGIAGEWIEPAGATPAERTLLYLHGGGYFFMAPQNYRPITGMLARLGDARVFVPAYRLAPEHRFPAALDDALAVYRGLLKAGMLPENMVVAGDSAGGGLTLALLVALRDAGDALPAGAICLSPWTDLAATGASLVENDRRCALFYGESIRRGARIYLGETDARHPLASPLYADLAGLPPLLIHAGSDEVLRDDSVRLAERARAAGVAVTLELWPGVPHVWQVFGAFLPESRSSFAKIADFIRERTAQP